MAQRFCWKGLSDLFKKDVPTAEETSERYLELARRCLKTVERKFSRSASSPLQFNHGQCKYLATKLKQALSEAEKSWVKPRLLKSHVQVLKIMKHLWRCARGVQCFIEGSHRNNWVQAAIVSSNMTEYVCQLSADLESCTLLFRNYDNTLKPAFIALCEHDNSSTISASIREMVSQDQKALLRKLETMNSASNSSYVESQLARCLASRLSQHLSGSADLECWRIQLSSLEPGQQLARGSGDVIVRKSNWMGEEVAEKVLQGLDPVTFRNEVQILAGLAHPNIVRLIGFAEDHRKHRSFIVMELMDVDLSSFMEDRSRQNDTPHGPGVPFSDFEAVDMMFQIAKGMCYLHEKRVVHRDLKPANILVKRRKDNGGEDVVCAAKVADFGFSQMKENSSSFTSLPKNIGTTRYMAPELLPRGKIDLGARTSDQDSKLSHAFKVDVYSFGMVCYEILTGQKPFSSIACHLEVMKEVLKEIRPQLPKRCPESLKQLICSCWDTDPTRRPSFEEILRRLRRLNFLMMLCTGGTEPGTFESIRPWESLL